ncbi:class I adenylate-forming enzyme family protein [Alteribacillus sp. YIM 98480]|uniref:class I adenylate-forming enzyme family protein n=1 Tax=Alteribacillus sp. YIM 98480 TaxID=2606599 RepID=UPI00131D953F|nr:class I adenylate-forming enzyme family protein [Alteribacillus sp. YIM 98480]
MITKQTLFGRSVQVYKDRPSTIDDMLKKTVQTYPRQEAVVMGNYRQTYSELDQTVEQLASRMQVVSNIQKGDRVGLLLRNRPEFIHVIFACARIGAIAVPLNTRLSEEELAYMLNHASVSLLFSESSFYNTISHLNTKYQWEKTWDLIMIDGEPADTNYIDYINTPLNIDRTRVNVQEEDPLFIMFTSGTTGTPKGAIGSHTGVIHSAINYREVLQEKEKVRTLIAVPLFHVTGLIGQMFYMVLIGGTSVLMKKYQTEPFIKALTEENITFLFNVPTIYVMMMSHPLFNEQPYPYLRTIAYGGAPISKATIAQLRELLPGIKLHNAYGATETSSPTTIMPVEYDDKKLSSVGLPVPVGDIKIVDEAGEDLSDGEVGELLIKGPMVVQGYWKNKEADKKSFDKGYWKSGDMAYKDEDDFIYIMDRKKDMINRGGEKIFSAEVESVLYGHPSVLEAAIVGIPDKLFGEQVKAYVVTRDNVKSNEEEIKRFLKERIADYKVPQYVDFVQELPRNPGGKVLKNKLVQMHG